MTVDVAPYLERLSGIYDAIDRGYQELAKEHAGFTCNGCEDLCCNSVFVHFTLLEHIYVIEGFRKLSGERRRDVLSRAREYNTEYSKVSRPEENFRMPCPLNYDSLCILYTFRPMACRIYGLPGVLRSPSKGVQEFEGCWRFKKLHGAEARKRLDRTPFYRELAELEREFRERLVYFQKYRKTIAQMLLDEERKEAIVPRTYDFNGT